MGNISTAVDMEQKTLSISADIAQGDTETAVEKAKKAFVSLSTNTLKGAGGLLAMVSEPEIVDGKLMMKVKFPFPFLKQKENLSY